MAIIQKETVWADEQLSDRVPARILEIELEHPLPIISSFDEKKERYYRQAYCLVRLHTQPLGLIMLHFDKVKLRADEYAPQVWQALHEQINEHLQQDSLPSVTTLDEYGLSTASMPRCKEEREQFLEQAPFVSVIVSTHDRPDQMMVCLNSLLSLRYPHYEIIVVDNTPSTDAIEMLVQEFSRQVSFIRYVREDCPGLSWARNRGIMAAKGEILAFTDDDVIVDPYWLTDLARGFTCGKNIACVTGLILPMELETPAQFLFEEHGGFNKGYGRRIFTPRRRDYCAEMPLYPYVPGRFGTGASMAFTADFLRKVGGFDLALGGNHRSRNGQDVAMFHQVILRGHSLVYQPGALLYHLHRRDYPGLRKQVFCYAVGITAFLTKVVLEHPLLLFDIIAKIPYGLYFVLNSQSPKNKKRAKDYPKELTTLEMKGMLYGPFAYITSKMQVRRIRKEMITAKDDTDSSGVERGSTSSTQQVLSSSVRRTKR